jgi:polysaccharide export outer membrane protein
MRQIVKRLGISLVGLAVAGCTNLPVAGPSHREIEGSAVAGVVMDRRTVVQDYVLVDISNDVLREVPRVGPGAFFQTFGAKRNVYPSFKVGVGDLLTVTIFESASGGLFTPGDASLRPGSFVNLPTQAVNRSGTITVPYAGEVRASGRTLIEIQKDIAKKLSNRAIEPQVVVTASEQVASSVTIIGETSNKLVVRGDERVLDVIARSGGSRFPTYELYVTLVRDGRSATVYFPVLIRDPRENIYVAPGDTIYLFRQPQKFVAVGALGAGGQTQGVTGLFLFEEETLSLNEAVAKAGGLVDTRANAQVFLYRHESRDALIRMGVDVSRFPEKEPVPTIYRANFRDPSVFFFTQQFPMRHRDAIYVSNSDSVELEKFLFHTQAISGTISGVSGDILSTRNTWRALGTGR